MLRRVRKRRNFILFMTGLILPLFICCSESEELIEVCEPEVAVNTESIVSNDIEIDTIIPILEDTEEDLDTTDIEEPQIKEDTNKVFYYRVKSVGNLRTTFNDLNDVHLQVASAEGFNPITDARSCYAIDQPVIKIVTCEAYHVDKLTHSLPFLTAKASNLLEEIGKNFTDSVYKRAGTKYKIRVTSLLRTESSVTRLRRHNKNASSNSAHRFGTTFDISYVKFEGEDPSKVVSQESLKNTLAEVLLSLRSQNRCYVKYEIKQGCFHITTR